MKKFIQSLLKSGGLELKKYRHVPKPLAWVKEAQIATVLDCGANIGQFAMELREELPEAKIYSFEPIPAVFSALIKNMAGDAHFRAFQTAIGEKDGSAEINVSPYAPSSSLLPETEVIKKSFPHTVGGKKETIQISRLDTAVKNLSLQKPILLKLDVQGYEVKALEGAPETLKKVDFLLIETSFVEMYKGQPLFDDIYTLMKSQGFLYRGSVQIKKDPREGTVIFEDSLFIRKKF